MAFLFFKEKHISDWTDLFGFYSDTFTRRCTHPLPDNQSPKQWVFRGLPDACYKLATTLERTRKRFDKSSTDASDMEKKMIRQFRRQAHLYLENPPRADDTIEWLALMQHFGAPLAC
jgi:FRG domain